MHLDFGKILTLFRYYLKTTRINGPKKSNQTKLHVEEVNKSGKETKIGTKIFNRPQKLIKKTRVLQALTNMKQTDLKDLVTLTLNETE